MADDPALEQPAPAIAEPDTPATDAPEPATPATRLGLALKLALVALAIGVIIAAWRLGLFEQLSDTKKLEAYLQAKKEYVASLGVVAYAAFVALFALLQPFGLPGISLLIASALVWPWPVAFGLSMVGATLATMVGFSFARFIARDAVVKRIPKRFRKYDQRLAERAFTTIFLLRTIFWVHPLLHVFFGTSKVTFRTHVLASSAAYVVPFFVVSYFGQRVLDLFQELEGWHWIVAAVVVVKLAIVGWTVRRWIQRRKSAESPPSESALATSPK